MSGNDSKYSVTLTRHLILSSYELSLIAVLNQALSFLHAELAFRDYFNSKWGKKQPCYHLSLLLS
jgi:hypothetical protein